MIQFRIFIFAIFLLSTVLASEMATKIIAARQDDPTTEFATAMGSSFPGFPTDLSFPSLPATITFPSFPSVVIFPGHPVPADNGLTQTDKIIIGVTVPFGIIILAGLAFGLWILYTRRGSEKGNEAVMSPTDQESRQEIKYQTAEMGGTIARREMGTPANTTELPVPPAELP